MKSDKNKSIVLRRSKPEIEFGKQIFKYFGIVLQPSKWIGGRVFDYCYEEKKILFECDGSYWHSLPQVRKVDKLKDTMAIENGYTLIRYKLDFERDVVPIIVADYAMLKVLFSIREVA